MGGSAPYFSTAWYCFWMDSTFLVRSHGLKTYWILLVFVDSAEKPPSVISEAEATSDWKSFTDICFEILNPSSGQSRNAGRYKGRRMVNLVIFQRWTASGFNVDALDEGMLFELLLLHFWIFCQALLHRIAVKGWQSCKVTCEKFGLLVSLSPFLNYPLSCRSCDVLWSRWNGGIFSSGRSLAEMDRKYKTVTTIGSGGFGKVYSGFRRTDKHPVRHCLLWLWRLRNLVHAPSFQVAIKVVSGKKITAWRTVSSPLFGLMNMNHVWIIQHDSLGSENIRPFIRIRPVVTRLKSSSSWRCPLRFLFLSVKFGVSSLFWGLVCELEDRFAEVLLSSIPTLEWYLIKFLIWNVGLSVTLLMHFASSVGEFLEIWAKKHSNGFCRLKKQRLIACRGDCL